MSRVLLPQDLDQLWQVWADHPQAVLMAGGTDLLVRRRAGLVAADTIIGLEGLAELKVLEEREEGVFLGAGLSLRAILDSPLAQDRLPLLLQAMGVLGSPPIRNMATLGGNLVTASPAGDTLPALYVLEAQVDLLAPSGRRRLPLAEFVLGPGRTALARDEVLAGVWIPPVEGFNRWRYQKVGQRQALAISLASLAALLEMDGNQVARARLAWGSLGPTVVRAPQVEQLMAGAPLTLEGLAPAADAAREAVSPISDLRASADYRRQLAGNLVLRLAML